MEEIALAIVGCGGMGTRHLLGAKEYGATARALGAIPAFRVAALCDPNERNANLLADTAAAELGARPRVYPSLTALLDGAPEVTAVDITTEPHLHHPLVCEALDAGRHVLVEKPLALTVTGCNDMIAAAARAGRVLSVAENYRRDPLVRLTRALLDAGAVGAPWMLVDASVGNGGQIVITPWRHRRARGCTLLDVGVHNVDLMLYYFGPIQRVYAELAQFDRVRRRDAGGGDGGDRGSIRAIYAATSPDMPAEVIPDVEDSAVASLRFHNGAVGDWMLSHAGHGQSWRKKALYGSLGSLEPAPPRSGRGPKVFLDGLREPVPDAELLSIAKDFAVDETTAHLFGGARLTQYAFEYAAIDRKITATVLADFARAIATGTPPEVGGAEARHGVAVVNALFESAALHRPVLVADVERGDPAVSSWQRELDRELGLA